MTEEQTRELLQQQQVIIEKLAKSSGKDSWDKLATLSTFLSSIVIGVIGVYLASAYKAQEIAFKAQEVRITQIQAVEKFLPALSSNNESAKKGALLALASLGDNALAIRFGTAYAGKGTIEALELIYAMAEGESKNQTRDALIDALASRAQDNNNTDYDQMKLDIERILFLKSPDELRIKADGYFLAGCYTTLGYACLKIERYDLAEKNYRNSLAVIPEYYAGNWGLGMLYSSRGYSGYSPEQALYYYDLSIQKGNGGNILLMRGQLHLDMGHIAQALGDYTTYIHNNPADADGYYRTAIVYQKKNEYANALNTLTTGRKYATEPQQQAEFDDKIEVLKGQMSKLGNLGRPKQKPKTHWLKRPPRRTSAKRRF